MIIGDPSLQDTAQPMNSKIDTAFIELREQILLGRLEPGSVLSSDDVVAATGVSKPSSKRLLRSLAAGGYLAKPRGTAGTHRFDRYCVSSFDKAQIEEWRLALCAIVEIGALKLMLDQGTALQQARQYLEHYVRNVDVHNERFFLGAVGFTTIVLGGERSSLAQLVERCIPQAFFRMLWLSDVYADRTGYLVEAGDRFFEAAHARDVDGVRSSCRHFFDSVSPALHSLIEHIEAKSYPDNDREDGFQTIEPTISGRPIYTGTAKTVLPLLTPMSQTDLAAARL